MYTENDKRIQILWRSAYAEYAEWVCHKNTLNNDPKQRFRVMVSLSSETFQELISTNNMVLSIGSQPFIRYNTGCFRGFALVYPENTYPELFKINTWAMCISDQEGHFGFLLHKNDSLPKGKAFIKVWDNIDQTWTSKPKQGD